MKSGFLAATALAVALSVTVTPAWALFETNKQLSDTARISMIDAIKTAEQIVPGKAVEVNMGKDDGRVVYKVEIVDTNRKTSVVYVDAENGKIHEVKR